MLSLITIFSMASFGLVVSIFGSQAYATEHTPLAQEVRVIRNLNSNWTFQYFPQQTPDKH